MTLTKNKKTSVNGINFIKEREGEKFTAYLDKANKLTVGVGHLVLPKDNLSLGDSITPMRSSRLLRQDLSIAEHAIRDHVIVPLNQNQYDALVSFIFNIGVGNFLYVNDGEYSTVLRKLNEYDYQGALASFPDWKYITVNGLKKEDTGLINRRRYEQELFNS